MKDVLLSSLVPSSCWIQNRRCSWFVRTGRRRPRETVAQELLIGFDYCPKASQNHGFLSNNQKHSEHPEASKILFIVFWPETMNGTVNSFESKLL